MSNEAMLFKLVKTLGEFVNLVKHTLSKFFNLEELHIIHLSQVFNLFELFGEANDLLNALNRS